MRKNGEAPRVVNVSNGIGFQFGSIANYGVPRATVAAGASAAPPAARAVKRKAPSPSPSPSPDPLRAAPSRAADSVLELSRGAVDTAASTAAGFAVAKCACAPQASAAATAARPIYHVVVPDGATVTIVARDGCVRVDGAVREITTSGDVAVRGNVTRLITNGGRATVHGVVHTQETRGSAPVVNHFG